MNIPGFEDVFTTQKFNEYYHDCQEEKPFRSSVYRSEHKWSLGGMISGHMTTKPHDLVYIRCLFNANELFDPSREKPVFLDLGSGLANMVIYSAHQGWLGFGVDFSADYHEEALRNIRDAISAGFIPQDSARVAYGNFFPPGFKIDDFCEQDRFGRFINDYLPSCPVNDVYDSELGLGLDEVDLFYHFQVQRLDDVLRLFSEHAKPGAMLFFHRTMLDETFVLPHDVAELVSIGGGILSGYLVLFQKQ